MELILYSWGYGTHVCPGRHFAVRTVKMVVATLLLDYDIRWDGEVHRKPDPTMIEGQFIPNLRQKVRIKRREKAVKVT
jgi:cytochrome P450